MTAPSFERRLDRPLSPLQRIWLELADAKQRGQTVRVRVLSAALRGLAQAGALMLLLGLVLAAAPPSPPAAAATWSMTTAARPIPKSQPYESWPDLATAADNSLVLVHSAGDAHVATRRNAVVRRSTDAGRTWKTVKVFRSTSGPRLWTPEAITRLTDRSLLLVVSRLRGHDDIAYVQFHRSIDNGRTWRKVGNDRPWTAPVTFGNLTQLRDGSLLMPWHGKGWGMVRCDATAVRCTLTRIDNGGPMAAEGRIFEVTQSDDRLVMLGRSRTRGILRFTSPNGGRYWTRGHETGIGVKSEGGVAAQGRLTLMLADRATGKVHVRVSSLEQLYRSPTAWGSARYLFTMPGRIAADRGYPAVTRLRRGLVYAVYAGDRAPSVRVGRLAGAS